MFTEIPRGQLASLVAELAGAWSAAGEGRRFEARGGTRRRAAGAGGRYRLVFVDRLVATLIHLRHDLPHAVLAVLFDVDRSTVTRGTGELRYLPAQRGFAVPDRPGLRLRTLEDVFAYAQAEGVELRLDATEVQVRRPVAGRGGRWPFVSGKKKQNTMKATVIADHRGRTLWFDTMRPGRDHPGQAVTPPRKPRPGALPGRVEQWERDRHWHSSDRITVEHALADHKRWKQLMRWTHRRDRLPDAYRAIAGLVSDRTNTA
ncbi:transposase family protein [Streptomyces sp. NPDC091215]|uniref:transposase family protein n=1 Tax=Streptomyces sp. NPDC091215 TaxID=3155192 RepID=UPI0034269D89